MQQVGDRDEDNGTRDQGKVEVAWRDKRHRVKTCWGAVGGTASFHVVLVKILECHDI